MRTLPIWVFVAAMAPSLGLIPPAAAQSSGPGASLTFAQAERNAVNLRQGMSADEVQGLLGKPRRTALKTNDSPATTPSHATLQWTYSWTPAATHSQGSLRIVFAAAGPEKWYVNSWDWSNY